MPAWSDQIAKEFMRMARIDARAFDQMHLQELVYIAHGWCLALTGEPLTGDRPEAFEHGPEYRRIADALAPHGTEPVSSVMDVPVGEIDCTTMDATLSGAELFSGEQDVLREVYAEYGGLRTAQLATLTRAEGTPWEAVYAGGAGNGRDIPHHMIRTQFAKLFVDIDRSPDV